jgi:hypothetical protein
MVLWNYLFDGALSLESDGWLVSDFGIDDELSHIDTFIVIPRAYSLIVLLTAGITIVRTIIERFSSRSTQLRAGTTSRLFLFKLRDCSEGRELFRLNLIDLFVVFLHFFLYSKLVENFVLAVRFSSLILSTLIPTLSFVMSKQGLRNEHILLQIVFLFQCSIFSCIFIYFGLIINLSIFFQRLYSLFKRKHFCIRSWYEFGIHPVRARQL